MGLEFKIDTEAGFVYTVGRGIISFEEFKEYRQKLISHSDFDKNYYHLVDYREAAIDRRVYQARQSANTRLLAKVAIVAGEKSYPFAQRFYGWTEEEGAVMVFLDMASAREWLGLPTENDP